MTSDEFTRWRKSSHSDANGDCMVGWRKSSHSAANGECVEVAADRRVVGVRDTKQRGNGLTLKFPASAWRALIDEAKSLVSIDSGNFS